MTSTVYWNSFEQAREPTIWLLGPQFLPAAGPVGPVTWPSLMSQAFLKHKDVKLNETDIDIRIRKNEGMQLISNGSAMNKIVKTDQNRFYRARYFLVGSLS